MGLINPKGSKILADIFNRDLLVDGNDFMNDIKSSSLKIKQSFCVSQLRPNTLTTLGLHHQLLLVGHQHTRYLVNIVLPVYDFPCI